MTISLLRSFTETVKSSVALLYTTSLVYICVFVFLWILFVYLCICICVFDSRLVVHNVPGFQQLYLTCFLQCNVFFFVESSSWFTAVMFDMFLQCYVFFFVECWIIIKIPDDTWCEKCVRVLPDDSAELDVFLDILLVPTSFQIIKKHLPNNNFIKRKIISIISINITIIIKGTLTTTKWQQKQQQQQQRRLKWIDQPQ